MKEPRYLLFCLFSILVSGPLDAVWFEWAFAAKANAHKPFALFPLTIFDSFLVGWFPALLFGVLLHYSFERLVGGKLWQWILSGAVLAWGLFEMGVLIEKVEPEFLSFLLLGLTLLRKGHDYRWPAAICGTIVSAVLWLVASKIAPVTTPAAAS
jgi:hypothetical protein